MSLNLDYKRILLAILIVIIGIGLIVGFFWLVFLRTPGGTEIEPGMTEPGGILPGTGLTGDPNIVSPGGLLPVEPGEGADDGAETKLDEIARGSLTKVGYLIETEVQEITMSGNGFNYLSMDDSKFYRIGLDGGEPTLLSNKAFPYADSATWSPDGNKVIIEYPDGANIVYDFSRDKQTTLPSGVEDPSFKKDSSEIAYKYIGDTEDQNWLVVSGVDGSKAQAIEPIGDQGDKVQISWSPTNQVVALYHKPIGLEKEEIFFIGLNDENFKSLVVWGFGFKGVWSPRGDRILYQAVTSGNNYNPTIWITDAYGDNIGANNFNLGLSTFVDKCVFTKDNITVYCAVPSSLPEGAGIYPDLLNESEDVFYKINLTSGISQMVAYPVFSEELEGFQVKKLFITDDGSRLYFLDGFTDQVYYLKLK